MKNHIKDLLEKRNIKRIVYVDNEFEINVYKNSIKGFLRENISNPGVTWPFQTEAGIDFALDECDKWLSNPENNTEILAFIKGNKINREIHPIEKILNDFLPEQILFCITPNEFNEKYIKENKDFTPTENNQLLILMDKFIEEDNADSGMRLLSSFKDQPYVACGLFSDKFDIENEIDNWADCANATNIYPIAKSRVTQDAEGDLFLIGLRNVVWLRQISDIKKDVVDLYNKAFKKTQEDLKSLDPASFDLAIIKNSANEGCWEFDVMKRIMLLLLNNHVEQLMTSGNEFSKIQALTRTLKQMSDFPDCIDKPNSRLLQQYYRSEVYEDITYINNTYSQIANGDIFEINGKKYMLSCQPCNLELRKNASRKSSDFVYLLPIEETFQLTDDSPEQIKKQNKQLYRSILQRFSDEKSYCVNLAAHVRISPRILDLVCYNKDGKAIIDTAKDKDDLDDAHIMQANMLTHYHKIYSTVKNQVELLNKIETLPKGVLERCHQQSLYKLLKKPFEMATDKLVSINCNPETGIIDFNVKRIGRYKEPYSQIVLQDFMSYLSRQALPNDFSKLI